MIKIIGLYIPRSVINNFFVISFEPKIMGWLILFLAIFIMLTYLLFAPFYIDIDSENRIFSFKFHNWLELQLVLNQNSLFIVFKIFKWTRSWDILTRHKSRQIKVQERKNQKFKISKQKIVAIIKSFKVRKFQLTLDTGDMPTNGYLFPVFYLIKSKTNLDVSINFNNDTRLIVLIENNLARLGKVLIFNK